MYKNSGKITEISPNASILLQKIVSCCFRRLSERFNARGIPDQLTMDDLFD